jgi:hypothetical protein
LETRIDPDVAISQSWKMLRTSSAIRDEIVERDNDCNTSYDGCKTIYGYAIQILIYKGNSPLPSFFSFRLPPRPKSPLASPRPVTCMFDTGLLPARPACGIEVVLLILIGERARHDHELKIGIAYWSKNTHDDGRKAARAGSWLASSFRAFGATANLY